MAAYFSQILVIVTLVSGLIWLFDVLFQAPKRKAALATAQASNVNLTDEVAESITKEPYIVETAHSIFPVIAFVLVLRSFLYEPFQIPSGSMMPTLLVGDFILVEKFSYGIREPMWRNKIIETGKPERGDIVVFKYPLDPKIDYIKRVVGLPGDKVFYQNKELFIQRACAEGEVCQSVPSKVERVSLGDSEFVQDGSRLKHFNEQLGNVGHEILINPARPDMRSMFYRGENLQVGEFVVPEGQYFVMGDNRDNSTDSRFWGFVPEDNLVGKAVAIWISFEFDRKPSDTLPTWVPTGVRFERVGGIK
ncbi:signal peptidase I [Shewanella sp. JM162201]|uniref:Signal peptidase I n=1 Tax=Shewanella jiangmenensis TaxID=2837387 RepID=A0ABS5V213_9GAMM|nr:signal peptidase I [Shewanella jiangmenensis]MBT1444504.1 signal peptidase I [Shewanella jiangmenensis]